MHPVAIIAGLSVDATERLLQIDVTDGQGQESDSVDLTLDDRDQAIPIPPQGATLSVSIGYLETGVIFKGTYTVDSMRVSAPPYQVKVRAKAVDMKGTFKQKGSKGFENKTVGDIVQDISGKNGYAARISPGLAAHKVDYIAQSDESGMHFLTRLANDYDAFFKVANGQVIFAEKGDLLAVSGAALGGCIVTLGNIISYDCEVMQRPRAKEGEKKGWDRKKGKSFTEKSSSLKGKSADRHRYLSSEKGDAKRKSKGRANKAKRERGTLSITIVGTPGVTAESPVVVFGVRAGVDGVWRAKSVTHHISGSNVYTTKIECEKPNEDKDPGGVPRTGGSAANPYSGFNINTVPTAPL